ncbi:peptide chain release factor N(5)-glutamine methyltransferase [Corynebacterium breve]|uniref:Release factor glutamine methyltransferase n=1 Tax=Corynebacterium breve TaxID=3049799 RepID=A0ABY8VK72_9CORY|nr:peptide chain release factor N(5)-glutamine methyltransferase [Corynebacterium breve]WIM68628.1 peptide chain release factor N(5)-glutamine methyltransferase [Corynebacterium breve]
MNALNDSKRNRLRQLIDDATARLTTAGVASPVVDAKILAAELLDVRPLQLGLLDDFPDDFPARYETWVTRREAREPLQHIIGSAPFGPLDLSVGPGVFIPRPETEVLAEWAVGQIKLIDEPLVVDLGTGTGALALYIAHARPDARVFAVEKSATARAFAETNMKSTGSSISIVAGDMTDPQLLAEFDGVVDLVVSNPPYVPETKDLDAEVYIDPHDAVFAGNDGMTVIEGLVPVASRLLRPGGVIGIEHDDATSQAVQDVVTAHGGFTTPQVVKDLAGRDRFVVAGKLAQE